MPRLRKTEENNTNSYSYTKEELLTFKKEIEGCNGFEQYAVKMGAIRLGKLGGITILIDHNGHVPYTELRKMQDALENMLNNDP